jgi:hypothetical protein
MCHSCLRRIFTLSVNDPGHMPPRCCTSDEIPLKHVDRLFDTRFKIKWNNKFLEYTTKNRIYCPTRGCGEWIRPANIYVDTSGGANGGRKCGKCGRCKTKVCVACNGRWHTGPDCPKDEASQRFAEIAKEQGWQRCFNCSATVELQEGCNHMTCRCKAEFCMICGAKWKSCDCPWFNYTTVLDSNRLPGVNAGAAAPRRYQEERDRIRAQERQDEILARHMQGLFRGASPERPTAHFAVDPFLQHATHFLAGAYGNVQPVQGAVRLDTNLHAPPPPPPPPLPLPLPPPQRQVPWLAVHVPPPVPRARPALVRRNANPAWEQLQQVDGGHGGGASGGASVGARPAPIPGGGQQRPSALAGLTRNTTAGRVDEWRRHVEGGSA